MDVSKGQDVVGYVYAQLFRSFVFLYVRLTGPLHLFCIGRNIISQT